MYILSFQSQRKKNSYIWRHSFENQVVKACKAGWQGVSGEFHDTVILLPTAFVSGSYFIALIQSISSKDMTQLSNETVGCKGNTIYCCLILLNYKGTVLVYKEA